jgi:hypothetical protein
MSEMSEREALERMIEGLRQAEGGARIVAHYRRDERWLAIAQNLGMILEKSKAMMVARTLVSN